MKHLHSSYKISKHNVLAAIITFAFPTARFICAFHHLFLQLFNIKPHLTLKYRFNSRTRAGSHVVQRRQEAESEEKVQEKDEDRLGYG